MNVLIKILKRSLRILTNKKGVYGVIGEKNKYAKNVFISEGANVGSYNYFGPGVMVNNATLKNYCSIGPGVKIGQAEHSLNYITTSQLISGNLIDYSLNKNKAVIGSDVWLGANVVVLQGVTIGNGAVVGANAVVTKDIPNYAIAVGIPAKVIKFRFTDEEISLINQSEWHQHNLTSALRIVSDLQNQFK